jgi:tetratricopeptide (TPR) repeat protein
VERFLSYRYPGLVLWVALNAQAPGAELQLGVAAYERTDYDEAVKYLQHAVSVDPRATDAHFYLGLAYDAKCDSPNPCDPQWSTRAIAEYTAVLDIDPSHKDALKSMAYLLYRVARFDEAEVLYRKVAKLDGSDPEALYSIAVLIFRRTYPLLMQEKIRLRLSSKQPLIGSSTCQQVRAKNLADIEEAITLLGRTTELVKNADVQTYLAVFYKARAELQCGDRLAYSRDLKAERQWWNRACVTWHEPRTDVALPPRWIAGQPPPPPRRGNTCRW